MKLLVWDTSSKVGTLAALEWDEQLKISDTTLKLVSEWTLNVSATHSERLLWAIDRLLESSQWTLKDIDLFGVGIGPGSFTGLRIGTTTVRTLAHQLKKPVIGVSSLAALARPICQFLDHEEVKKTVVIACTDACKGELFALWGHVKSVKDCVIIPTNHHSGLWKRGVEERSLSPEELMKSVNKKMKEGKGKGKDTFWMSVGRGRFQYKEIWKNLPQEKELKIQFSFHDDVQARYIGLLVWEAYQAGMARDALSIFPQYGRVSQAEAKLLAK